MRIGVPAETRPGETRVAATAETVKKLVAGKHEVLVQAGAGLASAQTDAAYQAAGATIVDARAALAAEMVLKVNEGRPNALDMIKNGELQLIINTPSGKVAREDEVKIRSTATANRIPIVTTLRAAKASLDGIRALREHGLSVKPLQEYH